jgi:glycosyltransferase involved in cell wall biosynthesis
MLSSQNALCDLKEKIPLAVGKARVVSFVAQIPGDVYDVDPMTVCDQYHLSRKFFFLPNQFWVHKNHAVVVDALTLLKKRRSDIVVVCTGNPAEFRKKDYYDQLVATIHERGLDEMMVLLGMVPHEHLFQLMRQSLSVLQPSLFEGWSTTIEEAKSLGKGVIASDISVHKEQDPPESKFFHPHDSQKLAELLALEFDKKQPGPDMVLETNARKLLPTRTQKYAEQFMRVVNEADSNY